MLLASRLGLRRSVLVVVAGLAITASARAHAPLARDLSVGPDGELHAVRLPGFGLLARASDGSFAYACDRLVGLGPADAAAPWLRLADGSMLVGTSTGAARMHPNGCPSGEGGDGLDGVVSALAVDPDDPSVVYAATEGTAAAMYRSLDGGASWQHRGALPAGDGIDAMHVVQGEPATILLSRSGPDGGAALVSHDAGQTFEVQAEASALRLLAVAAGPGRITWAVVTDRVARVARLMRRREHDEPWSEVHEVRFFGGFAIDPGSGRVWFADEAGGLFRSDDDGESFAAVQPELAFACLAHEAGRLWACRPGLPSAAAIVVSDDDGASFEPVLAFDSVERQVACQGPQEVAEVCALAWAEWEADVLMLGRDGAPAMDAAQPAPPEEVKDVAAAMDPPASPDGAAGGAAPEVGAMGAVPEDVAPAGSGGGASGCGVASLPGARGPSAGAALLWILWAASLRRRGVLRRRTTRYSA